jgi:nicotinamide mononucleotide (NMN) deamidase PncC
LNDNDRLQTMTQRPWQIALVISGGGSGAIGSCLARPGASRCFVEAVMPYSRRAMNDYLGQRPTCPSASVQMARLMAERALVRAAELSDVPDATPVGVAMTCALPTIPPRDHVNQIHVAIASHDIAKDWSRALGPEVETRERAETIANEMLLQTLTESLQLKL